MTAEPWPVLQLLLWAGADATRRSVTGLTAHAAAAAPAPDKTAAVAIGKTVIQLTLSLSPSLLIRLLKVEGGAAE